MFVSIAVGVILMVLTFTDFDTVGDEAICSSCWPVGAFIGLSYVLLGLTVFSALAGAVISAVVNPKGIRGSLIGLGVMVVILGISYALASDEVIKSYGDVTASASKWSGTGLYAFYILFILAILSIVFSAVSRAFK